MKQTWIEQMRSLGGEEDAGLISDHLRAQNEVRARRGLEPLPDPTRIEGFDDDLPPERGPSPLERHLMAHQVAPAPPPRPAPEPPPSPMVPPPLTANQPPLVERRSLNVTLPNPTAPVSEPDLLVLDHEASWQGRNVKLSNPDRAAIARIVLQAIESDIRRELAALASPRAPKPEAAAAKPKRAYRKAKNGRRKKKIAEKPE